MHLQFAMSTLLAASKSTTKTTSSAASFYIILLLFVAVYFFYLRPRRAKLMARQAAMRADAAPEIQAGDTVVTTSGIIGRVLSIDGDRASVEIAPDTVVEFQRTALGRRLAPDAPDEGDRWASLTEGESAVGTGTAADSDGEVEGGSDPSGDEPHGGVQ